MEMLLKGMLTGFILVVPGMSGGTLLLLLGLYEKLMRDLSRLRIWPWLPFIAGAAAGILINGAAFSWLLQAYAPFVTAFLLGSMLASVRAVMGGNFRPNWRRIGLLALGAAIGLLLAGQPLAPAEGRASPSPGLIFIAGALGCATMILPGVAGSSVLLMLGVYDDMLAALGRLDWLLLSVFIVGAAVGAFGLSNALDNLFARHRASISWLFSGLILGSARMLIPAAWVHPAGQVFLGLAGFVLVWWWGGKKQLTGQ
ncbi:MAG: DUF368 domain-containing protein [Firmicutes bacterium]|nr:DUF368 domain-containing protein [Bacillota bacterium]